MITYKNRVIDYNKPVDVYRCLNRKGFIFSLRQNGLVVAHTDKIILTDCTFIINKSGLNLYLKTGHRNVHAFIRGKIGTSENIKNEFSFILSYQPTMGGFYTSLGKVDDCDVAYIQEKNFYCQ